MIWEASIALIILMFVLWGAAIWASYQEGSELEINSRHVQDRKAA